MRQIGNFINGREAMNIILGAKYKDVISGYEGIAIGSVAYITGCNQALLQSRGKSDKKDDGEWVDEERLQRIGNTVLKLGGESAALRKPGVQVVRAVGGDREPPKW